MLAFEQKVTTFIQEQQLNLNGQHLLIACSGGVDSMALLFFLNKYQAYFGYKISCVHVDHMLRGAESLTDLQFVEAYCQQIGIPFYSKSISIPHIYEQQGGNLQTICRQERYAFFSTIANEIEATYLVTAHHADDQMESVLMGLAKKRNLNALTGIHPKRTVEDLTIIRPFLSVTKIEIREYLEEQNVSWREDASNEKDAYARNYVRHHITPALQKLNPLVAENIVAISTQLAEDQQLLMELAYTKFSKVVTKTVGNNYQLKIDDLKDEPVSLQRRLILILLNYIYGDSHTIQTYDLISSILNMCNAENGTAEIHLPNNFIALRTYSTLVIQPKAVEKPLEQTEITLNEWQQIGTNQVLVKPIEKDSIIQVEKASVYYFNAKEVKLPLYARSHQQGERIQLAGMTQAKRISRLFIDDKIPKQERTSWPIIVSGDEEVVAVLGIRTNNKLSKVMRPIDDYLFIVK
jgi:tRNA(Ile)-lysidine synthetase-like protein